MEIITKWGDSSPHYNELPIFTKVGNFLASCATIIVQERSYTMELVIWLLRWPKVAPDKIQFLVSAVQSSENKVTLIIWTNSPACKTPHCAHREGETHGWRQCGHPPTACNPRPVIDYIPRLEEWRIARTVGSSELSVDSSRLRCNGATQFERIHSGVARLCRSKV
jgi:hypothetical protein